MIIKSMKFGFSQNKVPQVSVVTEDMSDNEPPKIIYGVEEFKYLLTTKRPKEEVIINKGNKGFFNLTMDDSKASLSKVIGNVYDIIANIGANDSKVLVPEDDFKMALKDSVMEHNKYVDYIVESLRAEDVIKNSFSGFLLEQMNLPKSKQIFDAWQHINMQVKCVTNDFKRKNEIVRNTEGEINND